MRSRLHYASLGLALMALIGLGTVAGNGVFAQDATPTPSATAESGTGGTGGAEDKTEKGGGDFRGGPGMGRGGHHGGKGDGMMRGSVDLDALATFLGVTADDITSALRSGRSLAQIAEANGKTRDELKTFLTEQFTAGLDAKIDATHTPKSNDSDDDGVGGTDDASPEATPAAELGLVA